MSNIQKYSHLQVSTVDDLARISKAMAASGMFTDVRDAAQAMVKIQAGAELGLPPFASMSGVHVIKGKPVIGAGLMASMIDAHPDYDFEVLEQNDQICQIKFFKNGKARGVSQFTIEDARKAGTQNIQKFPANMLYARAMSNGAKWYCPGVFAGPVYVPEEMEEVTEDVQHVEVKPEPKPKQAKKENPVPVPAPEPHLASTKQKTELLLLCNNKHVAHKEKAAIVEDINTFSPEECQAHIERIKSLIEERDQPSFLHNDVEDTGQPMPWEVAEVVEESTQAEAETPKASTQASLPLGYKKPSPSQAEKTQRAIMEKLCKDAKAEGLLTEDEVNKLMASYDDQPNNELKFEKIKQTKEAIKNRRAKKQAA